MYAKLIILWTKKDIYGIIWVYMLCMAAYLQARSYLEVMRVRKREGYVKIHYQFNSIRRHHHQD